MLRKSAKSRSGKLPYPEFVAKYGNDIDAGFALDDISADGGIRSVVPSGGSVSTQQPMPWAKIYPSWFAETLRKAANANEPEPIVLLLQMFLAELGIKAPQGVFAALPKKRGRRKKALAEKTRAQWKQMGSPLPLTAQACDELAEHTYPDEYRMTRRGSKGRKTLHDRVRRQVARVAK